MDKKNRVGKLPFLVLLTVLISVGVGTASAITITLGGTVDITQILNMMGNRITNLGSPTQPSDAATKAYVDQAPSINSYLIQLGTAEGLADLTIFACPGKSAIFFPMDECSTVIPVSGNISSLTAVSANEGALIAPGGVGLSYTVTLFKNGIGTTLSCVISNAETSCSDSLNSVSVSPGDLIDVQLISSNGVPASWVSISAILSP